MLNNKKRGFLASAGALVTAVALALGGAAAAHAAPVDKMPESSAVVITKKKLTAETELGAAATGVQTENTPGQVVPGVSFEAVKVPLENNDPMTNEGRKQIANTTLKDAAKLVDDNAANIGEPDKRSGTTGTDGVISWNGDNKLQAGLWLVRETSTPPGIVPAGDFLIPVPLTDPESKSKWLDTIYVYPKNHSVNGTKTVDNAGELKVGDKITWTINVDNPSPRDTNTKQFRAADRLEIVDVLKDAELTTDPNGADVVLTAPADLTRGADGDYEVNTTRDAVAGTTTVTVKFTKRGLDALVKNPTAQVSLTLATTVMKPGDIKNVAQYYSSTTQDKPVDIEGPTVFYGTYALQKASAGAPEGKTPNLAGAKFMVFADKTVAEAAAKGDSDARAKALKPDVTNADGLYNKATGEWTTNSVGRVDIAGLRYSGQADGETFGDTDARFKTYYLVETKALADHQLLSEPVKFFVDENSGSTTTQTEVITNQYNRNGFVLPLTGGTGTLFLTIGGIALLAVVLIVARRRQHAAE